MTWMGRSVAGLVFFVGCLGVIIRLLFPVVWNYPVSYLAALLLGYFALALWACMLFLWRLRYPEVKIQVPIAFLIAVCGTPMVGRAAEYANVSSTPVAIYCHLMSIVVVTLPVLGAYWPRGREEDAPVCKVCGYCLRGLAESRCPECGTCFDEPGP